MTQILKSLQLTTSSITPEPPPSGFGVVYASGSDRFFYKNPSGTEFDLLTPNGYIDIRYYTGSGTGSGVAQTYTWSKPPTGLKYIEVCCVGAGGGGGGGRKGTSAGSAQGGTGGGGGAIVWTTFDAALLAANYSINIGAGGAGGIGPSAAAGNGGTGVSGGTSSFGTLVIARGGFGGIGGQTGVAKHTSGGQSINCTPSGLPYAINGCGGAPMANIPSNPVFNANSIFDFDSAFGTTDTRPGMGGGGGGIGGSTGTGVLVSASRGSDGYQFNTLITNGGNTGSSGGTGGNGTPPTNNMITTLLQFTGSTTLYGLGGGGHGGGIGTSVAGGNGSNGGLYGAGGGGGGAMSLTTAGLPAGNGGSGSSGLCIVVEFY